MDEIDLQQFSSCQASRPMTAEEREWCIDEADACGEGFYRREDLESMPDEDLAYSVLGAWWMYSCSQI